MFNMYSKIVVWLLFVVYFVELHFCLSSERVAYVIHMLGVLPVDSLLWLLSSIVEYLIIIVNFCSPPAATDWRSARARCIKFWRCSLWGGEARRSCCWTSRRGSCSEGARRARRATQTRYGLTSIYRIISSQWLVAMICPWSAYC